MKKKKKRMMRDAVTVSSKSNTDEVPKHTFSIDISKTKVKKITQVSKGSNCKNLIFKST